MFVHYVRFKFRDFVRFLSMIIYEFLYTLSLLFVAVINPYSLLTFCSTNQSLLLFKFKMFASIYYHDVEGKIFAAPGF